MGFIKVAGVNPPSTRPRVDLLDPMLAGGSLALYELGHPKASVIGVPANGALIPNVALAQAQALIPTASVAELSANYKMAVGDATKFKVERTSKGGLHAIAASGASAVGTGNYAGMYGREKLAQYIRDNINNEFFISFWALETRAPGTGPGAFTGLAFTNSISGTNLQWVQSHDGNNYPTSATYRTGWAREVNGAAMTGPYALYQGSTVGSTPTVNYPPAIPAKLRLTTGVKGTASVLDKTAGAVETTNWFKLFSNGNVSEIFPPNASTGMGSIIHYRTYIEDLTVSGRSYSTVDALDKAEYTKHVLTAGGRYFGDTYTAPSAFAA